jgi:uncharacterized membrane protein YeaQ/YmgE (transglycosylase-associated protein family)
MIPWSVILGFIHPKSLAAAFGLLVPVAVGFIAVRKTATAYESARTVIAVNMAFGISGTLVGCGISQQIYWQSHGTNNPWFYTIPGALLGGVTFVILIRFGRAVFRAIASRNSSQSAGQQEHKR